MGKVKNKDQKISHLRINKVLSLLSIFTVVCISCAYAADFPKVTDVKGQVEYQRQSKQWEKVKIGDVLEKGDRVKTYDNSRCDLVMDKEGKQLMGIFDNSEIIVLLGNNEKFELVNANVMFSLEGMPEGSTFEVKTPTAICGVRGTGFRIFSDTTMTQINAYYNSVYGKNFEGDIKDVPPGFYRTIGEDGQISKLHKIPDMEGKRFRAWKRSAGDKKEDKDKHKDNNGRSRNSRFERSENRMNDVRGKSDSQNEFRKDAEKISEKNEPCPNIKSEGPSESIGS
ncbi:MAG: FecR domain-containing protein [Candidatus Omnitrophica bacterium]|nr:FecR domain-containing protein [Candidatus Omnitrophota bacterium]